MARDIFQEITDRIASKLEQGTRPWAKPWSADKAAFNPDLPHNVAGRPYRGANVFWLWIEGQSRGYTSPVWLTFNQAKQYGGSIIKGEKATPVFFWKIGNYEDKKTGEKKKSFIVRQYSVFNIAQTEGVNLPKSRTLAPADMPEPARIEAAESLIAETGAVIRHGGDKAFYSPAFDSVQMPPRAAFKNADGYYGTMFHELGHWTGHTSRLDRKFGARFGDDAYAFEELVAELTAALVCGSQGFASVERDDHASYIGHWLKVMRGDKRAFITAAAAAQKAADLILGRAKEAEEPASEGDAIGEEAAPMAQAA